MSFRSLKGLCAWLFGLMILIGPSSSAQAVAAVRVPVHCPGSGLFPTAANAREIASATLCLIDIRRGSRGRSLLRANSTLVHIADRQVRKMVHLDYFADVGPTGQTPLSLVAASPYPKPGRWFSVGQNLAWGTGGDTCPARIVQAWMSDPPHRRIMLDPRYRDAGVAAIPATPAVVGTGEQGATYAMEFGVRKR
jgi:uncharacterized protein YkwD